MLNGIEGMAISTKHPRRILTDIIIMQTAAVVLVLAEAEAGNVSTTMLEHRRINNHTTHGHPP